MLRPAVRKVIKQVALPVNEVPEKVVEVPQELLHEHIEEVEQQHLADLVKQVRMPQTLKARLGL